MNGCGDVELRDFGWAIRQMKKGRRVARKGWNGKGMWLSVVKADNYVVMAKPHGDGDYDPQKDCVGLYPWIGMKTADNKFVPWLASQTDMLSEDWVLVD